MRDPLAIVGLKLSIVRGRKANDRDQWTNVLLRLIVNGLLGLIPLYGLVDILFIFRSDRRCIHDMLAGAQVVEAETFYGL